MIASPISQGVSKKAKGKEKRGHLRKEMYAYSSASL
jgi:hypothetical protein